MEYSTAGVYTLLFIAACLVLVMLEGWAIWRLERTNKQ